MTTIINHDLRCVDGKTIYLPPGTDGATGTGRGNLALPTVYSADTVQQYPIGTRYEFGERTYRYYKAGAAITILRRAIVSQTCRTASAQDTYDSAQVAGAGESADNPFKINGSSSGDPALNAYAGHSIFIQDSTNGFITMFVKSSTASAYDDVNTTVYTVELVLDQGIPHTIAANLDCDLFPSRFADCRSTLSSTPDGQWHPFVGVPAAILANGNWGWMQTRGPCFITCYSEELGDVAFERTAVFHQDGTIWPCDHAWGTATTTSRQMAGYTLATVNGAGSEWIMLLLE